MNAIANDKLMDSSGQETLMGMRGRFEGFKDSN
jgi:hypothetical protein